MRSYIKTIIPSVITLLAGILIIIIIPNQIDIKSKSIMSPRFFPYIISIALVVFSFFEIIIQLRKVKQGEEDKYRPAMETKRNYIGVLLTFICLLLWIILIPYLGFVITSFALLTGTMLIIGNRNIIQIILVPSTATLIIYYIFIVALNTRF